MSYELLDHTADAKFRAVGKSLEEVFSESVRAFAEIVGADPGAGNDHEHITTKSESHEALLFDFLDDLIFLQDTEDRVVTHVKSISIEEKQDSYILEAEVWTDPIDAGARFLDIKAPTYNEMRADYEKGTGWVLEAVLDI